MGWDIFLLGWFISECFFNCASSILGHHDATQAIHCNDAGNELYDPLIFETKSRNVLCEVPLGRYINSLSFYERATCCDTFMPLSWPACLCPSFPLSLSLQSPLPSHYPYRFPLPFLPSSFHLHRESVTAGFASVTWARLCDDVARLSCIGYFDLYVLLRLGCCLCVVYLYRSVCLCVHVHNLCIFVRVSSVHMHFCVCCVCPFAFVSVGNLLPDLHCPILPSSDCSSAVPFGAMPSSVTLYQGLPPPR